MRNPNTLSNFIELGEHLFVLQAASHMHVDALARTKERIVALIDDCGLLQAITASRRVRDDWQMRYFPRTGVPVPHHGQEIERMGQDLRHAIYADASVTQILALHRDAVTQRVRDISSGSRLNPQQEQIHEELVNCLERGTYRGAMVMGWNLTYDIIRRWVFDDPQRRATMNQDLGSRPRNPIQINVYEDFFSGDPGERQFIDLCHRVGFIREPVRDNLRHYLRRRNDYAHPSFVHPDAAQASAYLRDLLDVIAGPPFSF